MSTKPATLPAESAPTWNVVSTGKLGPVAGLSALGIDPGYSGGLALLSSQGASAWKMPETERDIWDLFEALKGFRPHAFLERVHSMPGQGVSSSFKFGQNYGFLRGCLIGSGIPFEEVQPSAWQKSLGCLTKGEKNVSKAKAQQLYPSLRITHAVADALLVATYGARILAARAQGGG